ncbi:hypothetical protein AB833_07150 [Chromatiales bacterium (ex Bugula neritina AB1)]|nr:hypothetical protein AB833_07150 [Chromatiales bacterium (ex Bugula neritina AB1)]
MLALSVALLSLTACGGGSNDTDDTAQAASNLQGVPPESGAANPGTNISTEVTANTDVAESIAGQLTRISILSNDSYAADTRLQLVGSPANGTASLTTDGAVEYVANEDFQGTDTVSYILVDSDGNQSTGTLYIAVACADCALAPVATGPSLSGAPFCLTEDSDPDGDGYGWENNASCEVPPLGAALSPLTANADSVSMAEGSVTTVTPLRNDSIADRQNVRFSIDVPPSEGRIEAVDAGIIVYAAPENYDGNDSLVYSITDANGETSIANIEFDISCDTCTNKNALRLSWPANPENEAVDGYRVYFGPDENSHTATLLSDVSITTFNGSAPNVVFDISNDLNISGSEGGCFRVQAYRGTEESEHSEATCFTRSS